MFALELVDPSWSWSNTSPTQCLQKSSWNTEQWHQRITLYHLIIWPVNKGTNMFQLPLRHLSVFLCSLFLLLGVYGVKRGFHLRANRTNFNKVRTELFKMTCKQKLGNSRPYLLCSLLIRSQWNFTLPKKSTLTLICMNRLKKHLSEVYFHTVWPKMSHLL